MSVFDFFQNHRETHGENRVSIDGPMTYELESVSSAYSDMLKVHRERNYTDKRGLPREPHARLAFNPRMDRACFALQKTVALMAKPHPDVAARCYDELVANDAAEYKALKAMAATKHGRQALEDMRRSLAWVGRRLEQEGSTR